MVALASQRRGRGLAASVIDTGMIIGLGHMTKRSSREVNALKDRYNFMPVSESELHNIFAEAIVAGRPDSLYPAELITGLQKASENNKPVWYKNPIFSHHREEIGNSPKQTSTPYTVSIPIRQQVVEAADEKEAVDILHRSFVDHLGRCLQIPPASINTNKALIELGLDSLMAVEIWSWIFKETGHNVSVLKILGGLTAEDSKKLSFNFIAPFANRLQYVLGP